MTDTVTGFEPRFRGHDPLPVYCPAAIAPGLAVAIKGRTSSGDYEVELCPKEKRPLGVLSHGSPGSEASGQTVNSAQLRVPCERQGSVVWWECKEEVKVGEEVEVNAEGKCVKLGEKGVGVGKALSTGKNAPIEVLLY